MTSPIELEIKLEGDPAEAAAVRDALDGWLGPASRVDRLLSRYYDTAAADLRASGLTLRVRDDGAGLTQTVKRADGVVGGLFRRGEWEVPLRRDSPDLAACRDTPAGPVLEAAAAPLVPVFRSDVERRVWTVERPNGVVEVAMDLGSVATATAAAPLLEVEIELKEGAAGAVVGLLRDVPPEARLTVGVLSKSERGFLLADGRADGPFKAEPIPLRPGMPAHEGVQLVLRSCLRQIRLNEPGAVARRAASLHQARVGLRRLRSAFSLFADVLADDRCAALKEGLRGVSRVLGEARNLDVVLARLGEETGPAPAGEDLRVRLELRRVAAYDAVAATLTGSAFATLLRDLMAWIEAGPWVVAARADVEPPAPLERTAAAVLERRRRAIRRRGRHLAQLSPEERHRLRIAGKKLRYATDFVTALAVRPEERRRHGAFVESLEALQEALGLLNDRRTAEELARSLAADGVGDASAVLPRVDADRLVERAARARHDVLDAPRFWRRWA